MGSDFNQQNRTGIWHAATRSITGRHSDERWLGKSEKEGSCYCSGVLRLFRCNRQEFERRTREIKVSLLNQTLIWLEGKSAWITKWQQIVNRLWKLICARKYQQVGAANKEFAEWKWESTYKFEHTNERAVGKIILKWWSSATIKIKTQPEEHQIDSPTSTYKQLQLSDWIPESSR